MIPLCWILRLGWNIWRYTFLFRPGFWDSSLQKAYQSGYDRGVKMGHLQHRSVTIDHYLAEGLWRRLDAQAAVASQD